MFCGSDLYKGMEHLHLAGYCMLKSVLNILEVYIWMK